MYKANVCAKVCATVCGSSQGRLRLATMREVAAQAGVSVTTVSHVINETRFVSEELVQRVQQAIQNLGYQPDHRARSLRRGSSETLAVLVSDISNPFFPQVVRGIEDAAREKGYSVLLTNTDENPDAERRNLELMLERRVDGLIVAPTAEGNDTLIPLVEQGTPLVTVDRRMDLDVDQIYSDNEEAAYRAVKHLIDLGHRRIGIIVELLGIRTFDERLAGCQRALREAGIEPSDRYVRQAGIEVEGATTATRSLLENSEPVSALFATNNLMTLGVLHYLKESRTKCPDTISLVGFDDPEWASAVNPAITSIAQQPYEMGYQAACMLISRIDKEDGPKQHICLPCELRTRESTGPCTKTG